LQQVRDQFRARNHEAMSPIIAIADAVPPDPLTDIFLASADGLGGFSRCHETTVELVGLGVKLVRELAQRCGKTGAVLRGDSVDIGRQFAGLGFEYRRHFRNLPEYPIMRPMPATATHEIIISPAYDHRGERLAGKFNARLGSDVLARDTATPFYTSAQALLARGLASPHDTLAMRHRGAQDVILQAQVGAAARMGETGPQARAGASAGAGGYPTGAGDPRRW
jgi:hypothetical protein